MTGMGARVWLRPDQIVPILWRSLRQTRDQIKDMQTQIDGLSKNDSVKS